MIYTQVMTTTIYGLDFTSAPSRRKPMYLAHCKLDGSTLYVVNFEMLSDWASFETWLSADSKWIAGLDFPFGQPREFIQNMGWKPDWSFYVGRFGKMTMSEWLAILKNYRDQRPPGEKHHLRLTDRQSGAISPMMVYGVPVGKMFFQGAPRLLRAGVSVIPNHPTSSPKIVLETYPKLIALWAGGRSYKSGTKHAQTDFQQSNRLKIIEAIRSLQLQKRYGLTVVLSDDLAQQCIDDSKADKLDSVLCAIQTAWASRQPNFGVPDNYPADEGWIVNPGITTP